MNREAYRKIIKAQLKGFDMYAPIKEGDYAIILDYPEKGFREKEVVKIEDISKEFCYVRAFNKSKKGWVHKNNLEKVKLSTAISDPKNELDFIPIRIERITTLKDEYPALFKYFGKRISRIFSEKMVEKNDLGEVIPKINPKVVIGEFLTRDEQMRRSVQGFVCKWGNDKGVIFVNINASYPVDEILSHEFSHILSYYSKELSEELKEPSIQLGITDEEMQEKEYVDKKKKEVEDWVKMGLNPHEIEKRKQEQYYLTPTEVFAHTEQMLYLVHKFKEIDIQHVKINEEMKDEEKQRAIKEIESRPLSYYKKKIMNRLLPDIQEKYKVKDYGSRKIFESLFDNIENYIPNIPR